jgi:hypothetical protein
MKVVGPYVIDRSVCSVADLPLGPEPEPYRALVLKKILLLLYNNE